MISERTIKESQNIITLALVNTLRTFFDRLEVRDLAPAAIPQNAW